MPVLLDQSRRQLDRANGELEEQRQLAQERPNWRTRNFQDARIAVDTYLTKVSEDKLLKEERLQPLRKELLTLALGYYEKFILQRADDPSVRKELAGAYIRAGDIYRFTYKSGREGGEENAVKSF